MCISFRSVITVFLVAATAFISSGATLAQTPKPAYTLTVLHTNDGESRLVNAANTLSGTDVQRFYGGAGRFFTVFDNLRTLALAGTTRKNDVLLINSGDNIIPGPGLNASLALAPGTPFYDTLTFQRLGITTLGIGNHEFDLGPDVLQRFIEGFTNGTQFLSANLNYSGEPGLQALANNGTLVGTKIETLRGGQRVGIIGLTTPLLPVISSPRNVTVDANLIGIVQQATNNFTAQGVRIVVVTSHLQSIANERALAAGVRDVDFIIAGGGQETLARPGTPLVPGDAIGFAYPVLENDLDGRAVPIVTTNGNYKYVGRLVLDFDINGRIQLVRPESNIVRVTGNPADADRVLSDATLESTVVTPVRNFIQSLGNNIVAVSTVDLDGRRNTVRRVESNEGNLLADGILFEARRLGVAAGVPVADLPIIAFTNGGSIRNDAIIPAGNISELTTIGIAPFDNFVVAVRNLPVTQLKEILENAVSQVAATNGRFAQISGFRFTWDAARPARLLVNVNAPANSAVQQQGQRIREVVLDDGTVLYTNGAIAPGAPTTIDLATVDFLLNGGDQYPFGVSASVSNFVGATYQRALFDFLTFPTAQGGLGGQITAADYPFVGEGRITRLN